MSWSTSMKDHGSVDSKLLLVLGFSLQTLSICVVGTRTPPIMHR